MAEYKSVFDGEQIDKAIGVIINGDIDESVTRAEDAAIDAVAAKTASQSSRDAAAVSAAAAADSADTAKDEADRAVAVIGKRAARFSVGVSTSGWTKKDCDYLCDGVDDQVEINAAIQALPVAGGEIIILDGTYNITSTIDVIKSNVKLRGSGNATIIKAPVSDAVAVSASGCKVSELFIDGVSSGCVGISVTGDNNSILGNMCKDVDSGDDSGVCIQISSSNNTITGNTCLHGFTGLSIVSGSNNIITGNDCIENGDAGISAYFVSSNVVARNICRGNREQGIYLYSSSNNTITGNICTGGNFGIYLNLSSNNTVTGNMCNNNGIGISMGISTNNVVTGNTCIRGTGTAADYISTQHTIYLSGTDNNYNLIADNNIMGKNYVAGGGTGNTFVNNKYN